MRSNTVFGVASRNIGSTTEGFEILKWKGEIWKKNSKLIEEKNDIYCMFKLQFNCIFKSTT